MSEFGGKGDGGKAKKGGLLDGLRSFGADFLGAFARNMSGSVGGAGVQRSGKPRDPVAVRDRPQAVQHVHRSLKLQRQAADEASARGAEEEKNGAANDDSAAQADAGSDGAPAAGGDAGKQDAAPESAPAAESAEKKDGDESKQDAATSDEEAKPSLSVAAKLKGVHRKVFLAKKPAAASAAAPSAAGGAAKAVFKPKSMAAGSDSIETTASGNKIALKIGGKNAGSALVAASTSGPLARAKNTAGLSLVSAAEEKVAAVEKGLPPLDGGKIAAADQAKADEALSQAAAAVSGVLTTMGIPNLARATKTEKMTTAVTVSFKSSSTKNELYDAQFKTELERQVQQQAEGLNKLSIDGWTFNVNTYKLDEKKFNDLDQSAKVAVLKELKAHAEYACEAARTKKAAKQAALKALEAAVAAAEKEGANTKAPKLPKDAKKLGIGGRAGDEGSARKDLEKQGAIKLLLKEVKEWDQLASKTCELAVLHNPDQIAGGGDTALAPLPAKASPDDLVAFAKYIEDLKKLVGAGRVNSALGSQWKKRIDGAYEQVTSAVHQTAWPINTLNLNLTVE